MKVCLWLWMHQWRGFCCLLVLSTLDLEARADVHVDCEEPLPVTTFMFDLGQLCDWLFMVQTVASGWPRINRSESRTTVLRRHQIDDFNSIFMPFASSAHIHCGWSLREPT